MRVIEIIMEALSNDVIITKRYHFPELIDNRDIYYRDPVLFANQGTVDRIVDVLAYTLLIPRSCLHVVSSYKADLTIRSLLQRVYFPVISHSK